MSLRKLIDLKVLKYLIMAHIIGKFYDNTSLLLLISISKESFYYAKLISLIHY